MARTLASSMAALILVLCPVALTAATVHPVADTSTKTDTTAKSDSTTRKAPSAPAAQAPSPKPATPDFDFTAWAFGDFQYETDSAAKKATGGGNPNKFDIGRVYLTFRGPLGDRVSYRVTGDIKAGNSTFYNGWFFRLKYGYLQYDWLKSAPAAPAPAGSATPQATYVGASGYARIGMVHTVVVDHEENFWPRDLTTTAPEHFGFFASADVGMVVQMSLPQRWGEIYTDIVNGPNYDNQENNRYKDFQARLTLTPWGKSSSMFQTFSISPWISEGGNASKFLNDATNPFTKQLAKNYYGIFVGNHDRRFTFGFDYASKKDDIDGTASAATDTIATVTGKLTAGFVLVRPWEFSDPRKQKNSIGAVVRLDSWKPNDAVDATQTFLLYGVFWEPTRKTRLTLDYQSTTPKAAGVTGVVTSNWFLHWNLVF